MKIAILTSGGVDRSGVVNVVPCLLWLIERLVQAGDEVHVFALHQEPEPGTWRLHGATIHNAGYRRSARRMFAQLVAEHRHGSFDVIQSAWSVLAALIGGLAGRVLGVPSLVYLGSTELVRFPDIPTAQSSLTGRVALRLAMSLADRVVVPSGYMLELARRSGISATCAPLGVALDRWPPAPPRRRRPGAKPRMLHVGQIVPVKDHGTLIETAAALDARGIEFEIDVIGEDVAGDGAVRGRSEALGLTARLRFHGFVPHHELRPYFERSDLLIVTSRHEADPLVAVEAAVAGTPTVGTNVGHLAEWAPMAARVAPPRDSAALAQAIIDVLSDEDARMALACRAQERALAEHADLTTRRYREIYAAMSRARQKAPRPKAGPTVSGASP
jgi:glycosyltransferase involved in cell wall biosynthesis